MVLWTFISLVSLSYFKSVFSWYYFNLTTFLVLSLGVKFLYNYYFLLFSFELFGIKVEFLLEII